MLCDVDSPLPSVGVHLVVDCKHVEGTDDRLVVDLDREHPPLSIVDLDLNGNLEHHDGCHPSMMTRGCDDRASRPKVMAT